MERARFALELPRAPAFAASTQAFASPQGLLTGLSGSVTSGIAQQLMTDAVNWIQGRSHG